jgi:hypothetical protein
MGHFGPLIEAERDETLSQYLRERGQYFSKSHEFRVTLIKLQKHRFIVD